MKMAVNAMNIYTSFAYNCSQIECDTPVPTNIEDGKQYLLIKLVLAHTILKLSYYHKKNEYSRKRNISSLFLIRLNNT